MGEIRKIITQNATAAELPERFRGDLRGDQKVIVTVSPVSEEEDGWDDFIERVRAYHEANPGRSVTPEEAVARVRALRDEWD